MLVHIYHRVNSLLVEIAFHGLAPVMSAGLRGLRLCAVLLLLNFYGSFNFKVIIFEFVLYISKNIDFLFLFDAQNFFFLEQSRLILSLLQ